MKVSPSSFNIALTGVIVNVPVFWVMGFSGSFLAAGAGLISSFLTGAGLISSFSVF